MLKILIQDKVWLDKHKYADAERVYYEQLSKSNKHNSSAINFSTDGENEDILESIIDLINKFHKLETRVQGLEGVLPIVHKSCSRDNTSPDTLTSIKVTNFKGSKMPESDSKYTKKCKKNCLVCEKVTTIQEHNDINKLLANVQLWDTQIKNQYKHIESFECLICSFKTQQFNEWKCHITSISHLAEYHMIQDTYSHVCDYKKCKVLLFGSKKSLCEHKTNHSDKLVITSISILMAEVMNRYISKKKPFYYCFHCKRSEDKPIHTIDELLNIKKKNFIEYYCKYCRVTFVSSPEMLDYHSLSVEHMTIKCLDQLFSEAMVNSEKIKPSKKLIPTLENKSLSTIQIPLITNPLKFPSIILHRFKNINEQYGECKLCSISVDWDCSNILKHLLECKYRFDLTGKNLTAFKTFLCFLCDSTMNDISGHKTHLSSLNHLNKCYDTVNLYSYFCKICNVYMYGHFNDIFDHQNLTHNKNEFQLPKLSIFMADMFKIINKCPNKDEIVHYEGINEPIESSNYTSLCCYSCKIQFESVIDYEMHEITNEHIILKFLTPKNLNKSLKHGQNMTIASKLKTTKSSIISNISLSSTLVAASEQKSVRVNENFKISNFNQSQMSKSKLREITKCKNCRICDKVTIIQEHNDIDKLLANVQLWDTKIKNQYKHIESFECLICSFKTQQFNEWKCHITSISHLAEYHMIQDTYSHVCDYKKCKVLLFGSKKSLCEHKTNHSDKLVITSISILMAEVMNRYISKKKPFYYCFHCKRSEDKPIHTIDELLNIKKKNFIEYYCSYCRVTFVCSPEMLDYHSLSVEHMTIKCLDQLFSKGKVNSKKIKLSAKSIPTIEIKSLSTIQIPLISNSLKFPSIILHRFKNINEQYGECKLCSISVDWDCSNILKHLFDCKYKFDLTGKNLTAFKTFLCFVCDSTMYDISGHKTHVSSLNHLNKCYDTANLYSYFCKICNVYMYGNFNGIFDHQNLTHNKNEFQLPKLSIFMADMFKIINKCPNKNEIVHYEGINEPIESSNYTSLCCYSCKIQFESIIDYEMHEITNEHIILKFLTPKNLKKSLKHGHDLTIASKLKTTKSSVISDISLSSTLVADSEEQSVRVNESANSVDVNFTAHLNGVNKSQEQPVNIVGQEESKKNLQNGNAVNSKQNYTNYINHKLKLLKLLKINKDRIIRTTSYYCNICDFMADEKHTWDKHNETVHPDNINNSTVFCTTCSMFILFNNFEEHNITTEHCNLLKFIQLFSSIRKKPILPLNNTSSQNERNKSDKTTNASIKICDVITSPPNSSLTTISTVSSHEPNIDLKIEELNTMIHGETSNGGVESIDSIFQNTNETTAKEIYKKPILVSSQSPKNVINLNRVEILYEDKIYGEYVMQRLGNIENAAVKNCIKLKIDQIFFSEMNKYLMENNNCMLT